jgi:hypothetical protein
MLGVNTYSQEYVGQTRSRIEADVAAFSDLKKPSNNFEAVFFNNMVLALDHYFMHRLRKNEGKDGNPLNEVRVISSSLMENGGVALSGTKLLGYEAGDEIGLNAAGFERLSKAYFVEIESRYS